jgi:thiamine pyrophosphate-dependent acetolactate synthase large subunit-like protein
MLMLIIHFGRIAQSYRKSQAVGPFIPGLKTQGFLARFCKLGLQRITLPALEGGAGTRRNGLPLPEKLIHIDIDAEEIGRRYPATVAIAADARLTLEALLTRLAPDPGEHEERQAEIAAAKAALAERVRHIYAPVMPWLDALREALPREGIVVADMTLAGYAAAQSFPVYKPRSFIHSAELCSIGSGLPLALGAKVAAPQRPVVALCGDGGFLLNTGELATAVQEGIAVIVIVFNDASYTAVKTDQQRRFPGRAIATELLPPDYAALARAFGMAGEHIADPVELAAAVRRACTEERPTLLEVRLP